MELRTVDPRNLIDNPDNPRGKLPPDQADEQMRLSIAAVGILQPPVVREMPKGLTVRYGSRRVRAAQTLKLDRIEVLVLGEDERADDDQIRAVLENIIRKPMSAVDQWRAIEKMVSDRWTEEAISNVLVLPVRTIRKLRLLATILPAMLDRMHGGDMPNERDLRTIAAASVEEQAQVWKRNKPKRGEQVSWYSIAQALAKQRLYARNASFGEDEAAAFGVEWEEDLFAPADEDSRSTAQVDAFMAAQHAWLEANLPDNGTVIEIDEYHRPKLPKGATQLYGKPGKGDLLGHYIDAHTGEIRTTTYALAQKRTQSGSGAAGGVAADSPKPRADVTGKGVAMIGDLRTDALHQALREKSITDDQLIGLLVLALGARNVEVKTGIAGWSMMSINQRARIAEALTEGGALTSDLDTLRHAAREMLVMVLSCRDNHSASGMGARHAGMAIDADALLPNMATAEFLACLSKGALERLALAEGLPPGPRAKDTRAALIARFGEGMLVYPGACFAPSEAELAARRDPSGLVPDTGGDDDEAQPGALPEAAGLDADSDMDGGSEHDMAEDDVVLDEDTAKAA